MRIFIAILSLLLMNSSGSLQAQNDTDETAIFAKCLSHTYVQKYFSGYDQIVVIESPELPAHLTQKVYEIDKPVMFFKGVEELFMRGINRWISLKKFWLNNNLAKVSITFSGDREVTLTLNKIDGSWQIQ